MGATAVTGSGLMKAIRKPRYGPPEVLELRDVAVAALGPGQVLVRVHASSVNALDWHELRGEPLLVRMTDGWRRPKDASLGTDVAGVVEAIGAGADGVEIGQRVFGVAKGAFAQLVVARATNLVPIPANLSFQQAGAVPVAATTALQALRDQGRIERGQAVLVHGAGGGVGTFAVQIAKALGGTVTAVSGSRNVELLRSIGADEVIDYTREDFTRRAGHFDLVVDVAGTRSVAATRRALKPEGSYVLVGGPSGRWLRPMDRFLTVVVQNRFTRQRLVGFISKISRNDLMTLAGWLESGTISPVIDRTFPLCDVPAAIRYVEERRASGKVVIETAPG
jgi:NADPH:quinone reductase-like Zn-dependent oxidoreductase